MRVKVNGNIYRKVDGDRWVCVAEVPDIFNEIEVCDSDYQDDVARKMVELGMSLDVCTKPVKVEKFLSESGIILSIDCIDHEDVQSKLLLWCKSIRSLCRKGSADFWNDVQAVGLSLPEV